MEGITQQAYNITIWIILPLIIFITYLFMASLIGAEPKWLKDIKSKINQKIDSEKNEL